MAGQVIRQRQTADQEREDAEDSNLLERLENGVVAEACAGLTLQEAQVVQAVKDHGLKEQTRKDRRNAKGTHG